MKTVWVKSAQELTYFDNSFALNVESILFHFHFQKSCVADGETTLSTIPVMSRRFSVPLLAEPRHHQTSLVVLIAAPAVLA